MAKDNNLRDFLQGIASAIKTKKGTSGIINAQDFESEIASIEGGGGVVDEYFYYSKAYYTITNNSTLFSNAWQDMKDSETVLFDIPLALAAPNQEMGGMTIDLYVGTDGQLQALYDACANGTIPPPIDNVTRDVYYVNNVATFYRGDVSGDVGFPIPLYNFGTFGADDNTSFLIGDLTPLSMGLGLVLAKFVNVPIPNNNIVIQQGFEFENESGIIIPDSVTSIGYYAFSNWEANNQPLIISNSVTSIENAAFAEWNSNNQPLIIPNSVTSIGDWAFSGWFSNNQQLAIPNSVTSIGEYAFYYWTANNQPLVIPDSVTSIGNFAFSSWSVNNQSLTIPNSLTDIGDYAFIGWSSNNQPLIIPNSVTTIGDSAFAEWNSNNQPLIIPNSVTSIGHSAFYSWTSNDQPLVIPESVMSLEYAAFYDWSANNQPLIIPNSVTSIGNFAFAEWKSNNQPLIIPNSVTSIGSSAFYNWELVPYVEIQAITRPTLVHENAFGNQNNAPIYVPDESVDDYKTNWSGLASRIFSINDK